MSLNKLDAYFKPFTFFLLTSLLYQVMNTFCKQICYYETAHTEEVFCV